MPRQRPSYPVVHRTARVGLRVPRAQRRRCFGLLHSAGDVWACVLELNALRGRRGDAILVGYQALCRELTRAGPGTFGELSTEGARSVLRRYSDAWFAAAKRRRTGDHSARFPRRRRALVPSRYYHGTFSLVGRRLQLPTAAAAPPLFLRLAREVPYPAETVRSITLLAEGGRLFVDVTAEVPVAKYDPVPGRVAGVDLGVILTLAASATGSDWREATTGLGPPRPASYRRSRSSTSEMARIRHSLQREQPLPHAALAQLGSPVAFGRAASSTGRATGF